MAIIDFFIYPVAFLSLFLTLFYLVTFLEKKDKIRTKINSHKPFISIIVPAYNKEDVIADTINSILDAEYPKTKLEVMVVDDGSTDSTYKKIKQFKDPRVIVFHKENGGKSRALNFGISKAKGEIIACIDADTILTKNLLLKAASCFKDPTVTIAVPTLKPFKPKNLLEKIQVVEYTIASFTRKILSYSQSLSAAPACSFFRSSFFKKHGGYDEDNLTEDFEMALKAQSHNCKLVHMIDAIAYTDVPKTMRELSRQRIRWCYGGLYNINKYKKMINKKYGDFGVLFFPMIFISVIIALVMFSLITIYYTTKLITTVSLLKLTGFSLNFSWKPIYLLNHILNLKVFLGLIIVAFTLIIFYLSKRYTRESNITDKLNNSNINLAVFFVYAFIYSLLLLSYWGISMGYFLIGKTPKW